MSLSTLLSSLVVSDLLYWYFSWHCDDDDDEGSCGVFLIYLHRRLHEHWFSLKKMSAGLGTPLQRFIRPHSLIIFVERKRNIMIYQILSPVRWCNVLAWLFASFRVLRVFCLLPVKREIRILYCVPGIWSSTKGNHNMLALNVLVSICFWNTSIGVLQRCFKLKEQVRREEQIILLLPRNKRVQFLSRPYQNHTIPKQNDAFWKKMLTYKNDIIMCLCQSSISCT